MYWHSKESTFNVVTRIKQGGVKISPLIAVLRQLEKEKSKTLSSIKIFWKKNFSFALITFKEASVIPLFPLSEYTSEDHLRLDTAYKPGMSAEEAFGYRVAHHTEKYIHRTQPKNSIKVHYYLSETAECLEYQVKVFSEGSEGVAFTFVSAEEEAFFLMRLKKMLKNQVILLNFYRKSVESFF